MVISWRFNYVFSLLPSVIKETILKKGLWDGSLEEGQGQQGFGDQEKDGGGWEQAECSGAEPPGLSSHPRGAHLGLCQLVGEGDDLVIPWLQGHSTPCPAPHWVRFISPGLCRERSGAPCRVRT